MTQLPLSQPFSTHRSHLIPIQAILLIISTLLSVLTQAFPSQSGTLSSESFPMAYNLPDDRFFVTISTNSLLIHNHPVLSPEDAHKAPTITITISTPILHHITSASLSNPFFNPNLDHHQSPSTSSSPHTFIGDTYLLSYPLNQLSPTDYQCNRVTSFHFDAKSNKYRFSRVSLENLPLSCTFRYQPYKNLKDPAFFDNPRISADAFTMTNPATLNLTMSHPLHSASTTHPTQHSTLNSPDPPFYQKNLDSTIQGIAQQYSSSLVTVLRLRYDAGPNYTTKPSSSSPSSHNTNPDNHNNITSLYQLSVKTPPIYRIANINDHIWFIYPFLFLSDTDNRVYISAQHLHNRTLSPTSLDLQRLRSLKKQHKGRMNTNTDNENRKWLPECQPIPRSPSSRTRFPHSLSTNFKQPKSPQTRQRTNTTTSLNYLHDNNDGLSGPFALFSTQSFPESSNTSSQAQHPDPASNCSDPNHSSFNCSHSTFVDASHSPKLRNNETFHVNKDYLDLDTIQLDNNTLHTPDNVNLPKINRDTTDIVKTDPSNPKYYNPRDTIPSQDNDFYQNSQNVPNANETGGVEDEFDDDDCWNPEFGPRRSTRYLLQRLLPTYSYSLQPSFDFTFQWDNTPAQRNSVDWSASGGGNANLPHRNANTATTPKTTTNQTHSSSTPSIASESTRKDTTQGLNPNLNLNMVCSNPNINFIPTLGGRGLEFMVMGGSELPEGVRSFSPTYWVDANKRRSSNETNTATSASAETKINYDLQSYPIALHLDCSFTIRPLKTNNVAQLYIHPLTLDDSHPTLQAQYSSHQSQLVAKHRNELYDWQQAQFAGEIVGSQLSLVDSDSRSQNSTPTPPTSPTTNKTRNSYNTYNTDSYSNPIKPSVLLQLCPYPITKYQLKSSIITSYTRNSLLVYHLDIFVSSSHSIAFTPTSIPIHYQSGFPTEFDPYWPWMVYFATPLTQPALCLTHTNFIHRPPWLIRVLNDIRSKKVKQNEKRNETNSHNNDNPSDNSTMTQIDDVQSTLPMLNFTKPMRVPGCLVYSIEIKPFTDLRHLMIDPTKQVYTCDHEDSRFQLPIKVVMEFKPEHWIYQAAASVVYDSSIDDNNSTDKSARNDRFRNNRVNADLFRFDQGHGRDDHDDDNHDAMMTDDFFDRLYNSTHSFTTAQYINNNRYYYPPSRNTMYNSPYTNQNPGFRNNNRYNMRPNPPHNPNYNVNYNYQTPPRPRTPPDPPKSSSTPSSSASYIPLYTHISVYTTHPVPIGTKCTISTLFQYPDLTHTFAKSPNSFKNRINFLSNFANLHYAGPPNPYQTHTPDDAPPELVLTTHRQNDDLAVFSKMSQLFALSTLSPNPTLPFISQGYFPADILNNPDKYQGIPLETLSASVKTIFGAPLHQNPRVDLKRSYTYHPPQSRIRQPNSSSSTTPNTPHHHFSRLSYLDYESPTEMETDSSNNNTGYYSDFSTGDYDYRSRDSRLDPSLVDSAHGNLDNDDNTGYGNENDQIDGHRGDLKTNCDDNSKCVETLSLPRSRHNINGVSDIHDNGHGMSLKMDTLQYSSYHPNRNPQPSQSRFSTPNHNNNMSRNFNRNMDPNVNTNGRVSQNTAPAFASSPYPSSPQSAKTFHNNWAPANYVFGLQIYMNDDAYGMRLTMSQQSNVTLTSPLPPQLSNTRPLDLFDGHGVYNASTGKVEQTLAPTLPPTNEFINPASLSPSCSPRLSRNQLRVYLATNVFKLTQTHSQTLTQTDMQTTASTTNTTNTTNVTSASNFSLNSQFDSNPPHNHQTDQMFLYDRSTVLPCTYLYAPEPLYIKDFQSILYEATVFYPSHSISLCYSSNRGLTKQMLAKYQMEKDDNKRQYLETKYATILSQTVPLKERQEELRAQYDRLLKTQWINRMRYSKLIQTMDNRDRNNHHDQMPSSSSSSPASSSASTATSESSFPEHRLFQQAHLDLQQGNTALKSLQQQLDRADELVYAHMRNIEHIAEEVIDPVIVRNINSTTSSFSLINPLECSTTNRCMVLFQYTPMGPLGLSDDTTDDKDVKTPENANNNGNKSNSSNAAPELVIITEIAAPIINSGVRLCLPYKTEYSTGSFPFTYSMVLPEDQQQHNSDDAATRANTSNTDGLLPPRVVLSSTKSLVMTLSDATMPIKCLFTLLLDPTKSREESTPSFFLESDKFQSAPFSTVDFHRSTPRLPTFSAMHYHRFFDFFRFNSIFIPKQPKLHLPLTIHFQQVNHQVILRPPPFETHRGVIGPYKFVFEGVLDHTDEILIYFPTNLDPSPHSGTHYLPYQSVEPEMPVKHQESAPKHAGDTWFERPSTSSSSSSSSSSSHSQSDSSTFSVAHSTDVSGGGDQDETDRADDEDVIDLDQPQSRMQSRSTMSSSTSASTSTKLSPSTDDSTAPVYIIPHQPTNSHQKLPLNRFFTPEQHDYMIATLDKLNAQAKENSNNTNPTASKSSSPMSNPRNASNNPFSVTNHNQTNGNDVSPAGDANPIAHSFATSDNIDTSHRSQSQSRRTQDQNAQNSTRTPNPVGLHTTPFNLCYDQYFNVAGFWLYHRVSHTGRVLLFPRRIKRMPNSVANAFSKLPKSTATTATSPNRNLFTSWLSDIVTPPHNNNENEDVFVSGEKNQNQQRDRNSAQNDSLDSNTTNANDNNDMDMTVEDILNDNFDLFTMFSAPETPKFNLHQNRFHPLLPSGLRSLIDSTKSIGDSFDPTQLQESPFLALFNRDKTPVLQNRRIFCPIFVVHDPRPDHSMQMDQHFQALYDRYSKTANFSEKYQDGVYSGKFSPFNPQNWYHPMLAPPTSPFTSPLVPPTQKYSKINRSSTSGSGGCPIDITGSTFSNNTSNNPNISPNSFESRHSPTSFLPPQDCDLNCDIWDIYQPEARSGQMVDEIRVVLKNTIFSFKDRISGDFTTRLRVMIPTEELDDNVVEKLGYDVGKRKDNGNTESSNRSSDGHTTYTHGTSTDGHISHNHGASTNADGSTTRPSSFHSTSMSFESMSDAPDQITPLKTTATTTTTDPIRPSHNHHHHHNTPHEVPPKQSKPPPPKHVPLDFIATRPSGILHNKVNAMYVMLPPQPIPLTGRQIKVEMPGRLQGFTTTHSCYDQSLAITNVPQSPRFRPNTSSFDMDIHTDTIFDDFDSYTGSTTSHSHNTGNNNNNNNKSNKNKNNGISSYVDQIDSQSATYLQNVNSPVLSTAHSYFDPYSNSFYIHFFGPHQPEKTMICVFYYTSISPGWVVTYNDWSNWVQKDIPYHFVDPPDDESATSWVVVGTPVQNPKLPTTPAFSTSLPSPVFSSPSTSNESATHSPSSDFNDLDAINPVIDHIGDFDNILPNNNNNNNLQMSPNNLLNNLNPPTTRNNQNDLDLKNRHNRDDYFTSRGFKYPSTTALSLYPHFSDSFIYQTLFQFNVTYRNNPDYSAMLAQIADQNNQKIDAHYSSVPLPNPHDPFLFKSSLLNTQIQSTSPVSPLPLNDPVELASPRQRGSTNTNSNLSTQNQANDPSSSSSNAQNHRPVYILPNTPLLTVSLDISFTEPFAPPTSNLPLHSSLSDSSPHRARGRVIDTVQFAQQAYEIVFILATQLNLPLMTCRAGDGTTKVVNNIVLDSVIVGDNSTTYRRFTGDGREWEKLYSDGVPPSPFTSNNSTPPDHKDDNKHTSRMYNFNPNTPSDSSTAKTRRHNLNRKGSTPDRILADAIKEPGYYSIVRLLAPMPFKCEIFFQFLVPPKSSFFLTSINPATMYTILHRVPHKVNIYTPHPQFKLVDFDVKTTAPDFVSKQLTALPPSSTHPSHQSTTHNATSPDNTPDKGYLTELLTPSNSNVFYTLRELYPVPVGSLIDFRLKYVPKNVTLYHDPDVIPKSTIITTTPTDPNCTTTECPFDKDISTRFLTYDQSIPPIYSLPPQFIDNTWQFLNSTIPKHPQFYYTIHPYYSLSTASSIALSQQFLLLKTATPPLQNVPLIDIMQFGDDSTNQPSSLNQHSLNNNNNNNNNGPNNLDDKNGATFLPTRRTNSSPPRHLTIPIHSLLTVSFQTQGVEDAECQDGDLSIGSPEAIYVQTQAYLPCIYPTPPKVQINLKRLNFPRSFDRDNFPLHFQWNPQLTGKIDNMKEVHNFGEFSLETTNSTTSDSEDQRIDHNSMRTLALGNGSSDSLPQYEDYNQHSRNQGEIHSNDDQNEIIENPDNQSSTLSSPRIHPFSTAQYYSYYPRQYQSRPQPRLQPRQRPHWQPNQPNQPNQLNRPPSTSQPPQSPSRAGTTAPFSNFNTSNSTRPQTSLNTNINTTKAPPPRSDTKPDTNTNTNTNTNTKDDNHESKPFNPDLVYGNQSQLLEFSILGTFPRNTNFHVELGHRYRLISAIECFDHFHYSKLDQRHKQQHNVSRFGLFNETNQFGGQNRMAYYDSENNRFVSITSGNTPQNQDGLPSIDNLLLSYSPQSPVSITREQNRYHVSPLSERELSLHVSSLFNPNPTSRGMRGNDPNSPSNRNVGASTSSSSSTTSKPTATSSSSPPSSLPHDQPHPVIQFHDEVILLNPRNPRNPKDTHLSELLQPIPSLTVRTDANSENCSQYDWTGNIRYPDDPSIPRTVTSGTSASSTSRRETLTLREQFISQDEWDGRYHTPRAVDASTSLSHCNYQQLEPKLSHSDKFLAEHDQSWAIDPMYRNYTQFERIHRQLDAQNICHRTGLVITLLEHVHTGLVCRAGIRFINQHNFDPLYGPKSDIFSVLPLTNITKPLKLVDSSVPERPANLYGQYIAPKPTAVTMGTSTSLVSFKPFTDLRVVPLGFIRCRLDPPTSELSPFYTTLLQKPQNGHNDTTSTEPMFLNYPAVNWYYCDSLRFVSYTHCPAQGYDDRALRDESGKADCSKVMATPIDLSASMCIVYLANINQYVLCSQLKDIFESDEYASQHGLPLFQNIPPSQRDYASFTEKQIDQYLNATTTLGDSMGDTTATTTTTTTTTTATTTTTPPYPSTGPSTTPKTILPPPAVLTDSHLTISPLATPRHIYYHYLSYLPHLFRWCSPCTTRLECTCLGQPCDCANPCLSSYKAYKVQQAREDEEDEEARRNNNKNNFNDKTDEKPTKKDYITDSNLSKSHNQSSPTDSSSYIDLNTDLSTTSPFIYDINPFHCAVFVVNFKCTVRSTTILYNNSTTSPVVNPSSNSTSNATQFQFKENPFSFAVRPAAFTAPPLVRLTPTPSPLHTTQQRIHLSSCTNVCNLPPAQARCNLDYECAQKNCQEGKLHEPECEAQCLDLKCLSWACHSYKITPFDQIQTDTVSPEPVLIPDDLQRKIPPMPSNLLTLASETTLAETVLARNPHTKTIVPTASFEDEFKALDEIEDDPPMYQRYNVTAFDITNYNRDFGHNTTTTSSISAEYARSDRFTDIYYLDTGSHDSIYPQTQLSPYRLYQAPPYDDCTQCNHGCAYEKTRRTNRTVACMVTLQYYAVVLSEGGRSRQDRDFDFDSQANQWYRKWRGANDEFNDYINQPNFYDDFSARFTPSAPFIKPMVDEDGNDPSTTTTTTTQGPIFNPDDNDNTPSAVSSLAQATPGPTPFTLPQDSTKYTLYQLGRYPYSDGSRYDPDNRDQRNQEHQNPPNGHSSDSNPNNDASSRSTTHQSTRNTMLKKIPYSSFKLERIKLVKLVDKKFCQLAAQTPSSLPHSVPPLLKALFPGADELPVTQISYDYDYSHVDGMQNNPKLNATLNTTTATSSDNKDSTSQTLRPLPNNTTHPRIPSSTELLERLDKHTMSALSSLSSQTPSTSNTNSSSTTTRPRQPVQPTPTQRTHTLTPYLPLLPPEPFPWCYAHTRCTCYSPHTFQFSSSDSPPNSACSFFCSRNIFSEGDFSRCSPEHFALGLHPVDVVHGYNHYSNRGGSFYNSTPIEQQLPFTSTSPFVTPLDIQDIVEVTKTDPRLRHLTTNANNHNSRGNKDELGDAPDSSPDQTFPAERSPFFEQAVAIAQCNLQLYPVRLQNSHSSSLADIFPGYYSIPPQPLMDTVQSQPIYPTTHNNKNNSNQRSSHSSPTSNIYNSNNHTTPQHSATTTNTQLQQQFHQSQQSPSERTITPYYPDPLPFIPTSKLPVDFRSVRCGAILNGLFVFSQNHLVDCVLGYTLPLPIPNDYIDRVQTLKYLYQLTQPVWVLENQSSTKSDANSDVPNDNDFLAFQDKLGQVGINSLHPFRNQNQFTTSSVRDNRPSSPESNNSITGFELARLPAAFLNDNNNNNNNDIENISNQNEMQNTTNINNNNDNNTENMWVHSKDINSSPKRLLPSTTALHYATLPILHNSYFTSPKPSNFTLFNTISQDIQHSLYLRPTSVRPSSVCATKITRFDCYADIYSPSPPGPLLTNELYHIGDRITCKWDIMGEMTSLFVIELYYSPLANSVDGDLHPYDLSEEPSGDDNDDGGEIDNEVRPPSSQPDQSKSKDAQEIDNGDKNSKSATNTTRSQSQLRSRRRVQVPYTRFPQSENLLYEQTILNLTKPGIHKASPIDRHPKYSSTFRGSTDFDFSNSTTVTSRDDFDIVHRSFTTVDPTLPSPTKHHGDQSALYTLLAYANPADFSLTFSIPPIPSGAYAISVRFPRSASVLLTAGPLHIVSHCDLPDPLLYDIFSNSTSYYPKNSYQYRVLQQFNMTNLSHPCYFDIQACGFDSKADLRPYLDPTHPPPARPLGSVISSHALRSALTKCPWNCTNCHSSDPDSNSDNINESSNCNKNCDGNINDKINRDGETTMGSQTNCVRNKFHSIIPLPKRPRSFTIKQLITQARPICIHPATGICCPYSTVCYCKSSYFGPRCSSTWCTACTALTAIREKNVNRAQTSLSLDMFLQLSQHNPSSWNLDQLLTPLQHQLFVRAVQQKPTSTDLSWVAMSYHDQFDLDHFTPLSPRINTTSLKIISATSDQAKILNLAALPPCFSDFDGNPTCHCDDPATQRSCQSHSTCPISSEYCENGGFLPYNATTKTCAPICACPLGFYENSLAHLLDPRSVKGCTECHLQCVHRVPPFLLGQMSLFEQYSITSTPNLRKIPNQKCDSCVCREGFSQETDCLCPSVKINMYFNSTSTLPKVINRLHLTFSERNLISQFVSRLIFTVSLLSHINPHHFSLVSFDFISTRQFRVQLELTDFCGAPPGIDQMLLFPQERTIGLLTLTQRFNNFQQRFVLSRTLARHSIMNLDYFFTIGKFRLDVALPHIHANIEPIFRSSQDKSDHWYSEISLSPLMSMQEKEWLLHSVHSAVDRLDYNVRPSTPAPSFTHSVSNQFSPRPTTLGFQAMAILNLDGNNDSPNSPIQPTKSISVGNKNDTASVIDITTKLDQSHTHNLSDNLDDLDALATNTDLHDKNHHNVHDVESDRDLQSQIDPTTQENDETHTERFAPDRSQSAPYTKSPKWFHKSRFTMQSGIFPKSSEASRLLQDDHYFNTKLQSFNFTHHQLSHRIHAQLLSIIEQNPDKFEMHEDNDSTDLTASDSGEGKKVDTQFSRQSSTKFKKAPFHRKSVTSTAPLHYSLANTTLALNNSITPAENAHISLQRSKSSGGDDEQQQRPFHVPLYFQDDPKYAHYPTLTTYPSTIPPALITDFDDVFHQMNDFFTEIGAPILHISPITSNCGLDNNLNCKNHPRFSYEGIVTPASTYSSSLAIPLFLILCTTLLLI